MSAMCRYCAFMRPGSSACPLGSFQLRALLPVLVVVLGLSTCATAAPTDSSVERTWSVANGKQKIKGKIEKVEDGKQGKIVHLKSSSGKKHKLPLRSLSGPDQALVQQYMIQRSLIMARNNAMNNTMSAARGAVNRAGASSAGGGGAGAGGQKSFRVEVFTPNRDGSRTRTWETVSANSRDAAIAALRSRMPAGATFGASHESTNN